MGKVTVPSLSIRIDLDTERRIGPGKITLLEAIHSFGSISAAGRAIGMSYKRAWDLVEEINRICGRPAVEGQKGGRHGGGARLTPFGLDLVAHYRMIAQSAEGTVRDELLELWADITPHSK
jgi:molybdate transport system regulatory protein